MSLKHMSLLQAPDWKQDEEPFYHVPRNPHLCAVLWVKSIKVKVLSPAARVSESGPSSTLKQVLWVLDRFIGSSEFVFLHQQDADFPQTSTV